MVKFYSLLQLTLFIVCSAPALFGQSSEAGLPFIRNFTPKEYNANTQNWAVIQDKRGVMYFGNNKGVLEYDGVSWRLIPVNNNSIVRSLAINDEGVIFVGAVGEMGYLAPDQNGDMSYYSLVDQFPEVKNTFSDIWSTLVRDDAVYFQSFNILFRYKDGQIKSWPLNNAYHRSFIVHHELYLRQDSVGLTVMRNDSLVPVKNGAFFAHEYISAMLPYGDKILIGSRSHGLFIYDQANETMQPFGGEANEYLSRNKIYHGTVLPNGSYAFATLQEGLVVMSQEGRLLLHLDEETGLQYQIAYNLFPDNSGSLWIALANGISKVEIMSPITVFDHISGLYGGILSVIRFHGTLYVCTHQGVFWLDSEGKFEQIKNVEIQCWKLMKFNVPSEPGHQKLLLAASNGVYEIEGSKATRILEGRVGVLTTSPQDPGRVFVGIIGTIVSIRYKDGHWYQEGKTSIPKDEIRSMEYDHHGNLWMGTLYGGAYRLKISDWNTYVDGATHELQGTIKNYGIAKGIPVLNWNYFFMVRDEVLITTRKGIYRYDPDQDRFEKYDPVSKALDGRERWFYYINEDDKGNLWFDSDQGKGILRKTQEGYTLEENNFKRIIVSPENQVTGYNDENGIFWFGTPDGLFRYDNEYKEDYHQPFHTLIRKVVVSGDSTLFDGTYFTKRNGPMQRMASFVQPTALQPTLDHQHNSLSFHYAAPLYKNENSTVYSYLLEGYDNNWSAWTKETKKEYTNLPEGQFTFRVRARNFYNTIGDEASYSFTVLAPWYRTPAAYVSYVLLAIGLVYLIVTLYAKHLQKDNLRLEKMVETRTMEINRQKHHIEKQKNEVERSYRNVTTLSEIGQKITSTLDLKSIIDTLYKSIDSLMDASSFGVGVYNEQTQTLEFKHAFEDGKELPPFSQPLTSETRMAVWCFKNKKEVFINDLEKEYHEYISMFPQTPSAGVAHSASIIYVPLKIKNKMVGVITVQSFEKNAYQPFHLDILRTLAAYTAIAMDNSYAYLRLNEINEELSATLENLKQTQSQLVQAEKMASLGQLTAGVAHEINNPINFVSAGIDSLATNYQDLSEVLEKYAALRPHEDNSGLLEEIEQLKQELDMDYLLEEIPQLLQSIKSGANRTTEIVKSLRNFTRLDEDHLKKADINEGLDSTLVILRNQTANRINVVKDYATLPMINCYPGQLNQVFMNIISNAVQAIEGEGEIRIKTQQLNGSIVVRISDNGSGMSDDLKNRIFEPFFTTKDVGEGTGLGLSISYGIIEKHNGRIEVESELGKGTEFIIELPVNLN